MIHDHLHYEQLLADAAERRRASRTLAHRRPARRPGRARRASAALLVRTAERLAREPVTAIQIRGVSAASARSARRRVAG